MAVGGEHRCNACSRAATIRRVNIIMACARRVAAIVLAFGLCVPASAEDSPYFGLLRARDLTPFGFLRLDMRPAHAIAAPEDTWAFEFELAHQNTWAQSRGVERYLEGLPGRRELGPAELEEIRALPGENYLIDLELAQLDLTIHRKLTGRLGGYFVLSGVSYNGGFLDGAIENFHETFGFDSTGRPAVRRNGVNIVADLRSAQIGLLEKPTSGGMLDPTVGLRYSAAETIRGWNFVAEVAAKLAFRGRKDYLTTGKTDFGVQATLQRFSDHHAWYVSASGVYYDGRTNVMPTGPRIVPTLIVGYERRLTPRTHLVLQGYVSESVFSREETDLPELLDPKFQLSLGIYRRVGRGVLSFGVTENIRNFNNTPDLGLQLGWAYGPALAEADHQDR